MPDNPQGATDGNDVYRKVPVTSFLEKSPYPAGILRVTPEL